jgi:hypothetical protein
MSNQTSTKTGVKSSAQKQDGTRYGTAPLPASHQEPGAFGKESQSRPASRQQPEMPQDEGDAINTDDGIGRR